MEKEYTLENRSRALRQKKSLKRKCEKLGKIVESESGNRLKSNKKKTSKKRKESVRTFERMQNIVSGNSSSLYGEAEVAVKKSKMR